MRQSVLERPGGQRKIESHFSETMLILDTNHYSEFVRESELGFRLRQRMQAAGDDGFLTVVTAGEVMKGWLGAIQIHRQPDRGVRSYRQF